MLHVLLYLDVPFRSYCVTGPFSGRRTGCDVHDNPVVQSRIRHVQSELLVRVRRACSVNHGRRSLALAVVTSTGNHQ